MTQRLPWYVKVARPGLALVTLAAAAAATATAAKPEPIIAQDATARVKDVV
jgi:hypothetical protein